MASEATIDKLSIEITSTASGATKQLKTLTSTLTKLGTAAGKANSKLSKIKIGVQGVGDMAAKSNLTLSDWYHGIKLVSLGLNKIKSTVSGWIQSSSDYVENLNIFNVALGEYADSAMEYANKVNDVLGIDPSNWIRYQAVFDTIIEGFGIGADKAALMSQQLTQLGYDLASYYNLDTDQAMLKLESAISGELEPVRRIGYDLSKNALQGWLDGTYESLISQEDLREYFEDVNMDINVDFDDLTQADKALVRYEILLNSVTEAQGDLARSLNSPANQLRILKESLNQAGRAIGTLFIPLINKLVPILTAVAKVVRKVAESIAKIFGIELPTVDWTAAEAAENIGSVADDMDSAAGSAKKMKDYLLGFDELNVFSPDDGSGGGGGINANTAGLLDWDLSTYDFLSGAVSNKVDEITKKIEDWLGIGEEITSMTDIWDSNLGNMLTIVDMIGGALLGWKLTSTMEGLLGGIVTGAGISLAFQGITGLRDGDPETQDLLRLLGGMTMTGLGTFMATGNVFLAVGAMLVEGAEGFKALFKGLDDNGELDAIINVAINEDPSNLTFWEKIGWMGTIFGGAVNDAGGFGGLLWSGIQNWGDSIAETAWNWTQAIDDADIPGHVQNAMTSVGDFADDAWDFVASGFEGLGDSIAEGVWNMKENFKEGWENIKSDASTAWDNIKTGASTMKDFVNGKATDVKNWFSNRWADIKTGASTTWENIKTGASTMKDSVNEKFTSVKNWASERWTDIKTGASTTWENIKTGASGMKDVVSQKFSDLKSKASEAWTGIKNAFSPLVNHFKTIFTDAWNNVKAIFGGEISINIGSAIYGSFLKVINNLIDILNEAIEKPFKGLNSILETLKNTSFFGKYPFSWVETIDIPHFKKFAIEAYANGGFPNQGELFLAREAGAEMVGSIGGHAAVANNDQIVEAVSMGVYEAVMAAMSGNNGGDPTEITIKLDGQTIYNDMVRIEKQRGLNMGMGVFSHG